jgi:hypothetical protein
MIGKETDLMGRIRREMDKENPELFRKLHCIIHQQSPYRKNSEVLTCYESCAVGRELHSIS